MNASNSGYAVSPGRRGLVRQATRLATGALILGHHYAAFRRYLRLDERERASQRQVPQQFSQALLELGPLFVKLGQILSTRPDVLPKEYIVALTGLQEHVPPFAFEQVQTTIRDELGRPIEEIFSTFETQPVASASLAQAHLATLPDGSAVAVKVQRPFVRDLIEADLRMLGAAVRLASWLFPRQMRRLNVVRGFTEFRRYTLQELDFTAEAHTMERFRHNFADWKDVQIPSVYWTLVTPKVLTMERVVGLRLPQLAPQLSDTERRRLSHRLMELEMKMFIADGLFHADLHPGNIFFSRSGSIALLDFGMYGELSDEHRDRFILYWLAALQRQTRRAFYHLVQQTTRLPGADESAYYARFEQLANGFYSSTISQQSLTRTYLDIILSGAKYGFVFPSDLLLHAKALTTAEALAFALTPDLRFEREAGPVIAQLAARRMLDRGRIQAAIERGGPELLLLGELRPPAQDEANEVGDAYRIDWLDALMPALRDVARMFTPDVHQLRSLLDEPSRSVLTSVYAQDEVDSILDTIWTRYANLRATLPEQETLGARLMLHLSAVTIAAYQALLAAGQSPTRATDLVYDIGWKVYTKMGAVPMALAELISANADAKLRFATETFRRFPFSPPDYSFEDVTTTEPGLVAFNCLRCPVAEYFRSRQLSALCVNTWCNLDYPLARQWGAELRRSGSIAGGAPICDFRWRLQSSTPERPQAGMGSLSTP